MTLLSKYKSKHKKTMQFPLNKLEHDFVLRKPNKYVHKQRESVGKKAK